MLSFFGGEILNGTEAGEYKAADNARGSFLEVLTVAARLGVSSFGGPVAHLGYFRDEYVVRRKWLDERTYADLVALCQFLPGPASSQVGIGTSEPKARLHIHGGYLAVSGQNADDASAQTLLAQLPVNSALVGSPNGNELILYWKAQDGKQYRATISGTELSAAS